MRPVPAHASTHAPGSDGVGLRPIVVSLGSVGLDGAAPRSTGLAELDRVLNGGLVPGSATLMGGEPGIGKSTLLLQVLSAIAGSGLRVLLVSAEESAQQVRARATRLGAVPDELMVLEGGNLAPLQDLLGKGEGFALVVVDSVQAVADPDVAGPPGSIAQVRACADRLVGLAKATATPFVLVGHVTKDGSLAGPRVLEHLVDTVLTVEGDRHHALRMVRAVKHRFGPTGEVGLFEMADNGLAAVTDPYRLLLGDRRPGQPGSVVLPAMEGRCPLLVEVQALVAGGPGGQCRRLASSLDAGRLSVLIAVLDRYAHPGISSRDVFTSVVGGVRVTEPAADLAVALAVSSAASGTHLPPDLVVLGELGLGGEVRSVPHVAARLSEAARLGFRRAIVPSSSAGVDVPLEPILVRNLAEALDFLAIPARPAA